MGQRGSSGSKEGGVRERRRGRSERRRGSGLKEGEWVKRGEGVG